MRRIDELAQALADGTTTSRSLIEDCPGAKSPTRTARARARSSRSRPTRRARWRTPPTCCARHGRAPGRYAGIPIALKDLFDIAGEPTPAGSVVLADAPAAKANAPVVARMLAAGFIPVGRVNMTEFAFSGLGINPHYGTPASPWDRASRRIPGGSSSGTAVAVADGMAAAGLGTDTGGSCRIPAAFCGIVGYKPTARRVPITGVLPLAPSLDSVGPLAPSVACCAEIDAILAGETPAAPAPANLNGLRLAVPENMVLDGMDDTVAARVRQGAVDAVRRRCPHPDESASPMFAELPAVNAKGGFAASEGYAWHRHLLATKGSGYDPRIRVRIARGEHMSAADYIDLVNARARLIASFDRATAPYDRRADAERADRCPAHRGPG